VESADGFIISVRWCLGLLILIFGANGIFHFIHVSAYPPAADKFHKALVESRSLLALEAVSAYNYREATDSKVCDFSSKTWY
jgi:hypothetical protein